MHSVRRSWDAPSYDGVADDPRAWDGPPPDGGDSDSDAEECAQTLAGEFLNILVYLLILRNINDREFCTIMFWAGLCGVKGGAAYGLRPDLPESQSGHYNRKAESMISLYAKRDTLYGFDVLGTNKDSVGRSTVRFTCLNPYELAAEHNTLENRTKLREATEAQTVPPSYDQNPIVMAYGAACSVFC